MSRFKCVISDTLTSRDDGQNAGRFQCLAKSASNNQSQTLGLTASRFEIRMDRGGLGQS